MGVQFVCTRGERAMDRIRAGSAVLEDNDRQQGLGDWIEIEDFGGYGARKGDECFYEYTVEKGCFIGRCVFTITLGSPCGKGVIYVNKVTEKLFNTLVNVL